MERSTRAVVVLGLLGGALAGCAGHRSVEGWQRGSLGAYAANGASIQLMLPGGIEEGEERAARETLRALYFKTRTLDYVAANEAKIKRSAEEWDAMTPAVTEAYAALERASALPRDELARGTSQPEIALALESVDTILARFGGGPPEGEPAPRIQP